jgi:hypothetical protein
MEIDYDTYAEGEALLGWLNATVTISAETPFDANAFARGFATAVQSRLGAESVEIAHLKMTLDATGGLGDIAVLNLVRNDFVPELSQEAADPMQEAELVVNLRAEGPPELLERAVRESLASVVRDAPLQGIRTQVDHLEHFRPDRPVPTHRIP